MILFPATGMSSTKKDEPAILTAVVDGGVLWTISEGRRTELTKKPLRFKESFTADKTAAYYAWDKPAK